MKVFALFLILCFLSLNVFGQNTVVSRELEAQAEALRQWPAWLITEKGKIHRQEGRLSDAFNFFYAALDKAPSDPLIEVELARAFLQTGDLALTLFHLDRALEKQQGFANPEMVYDVRYFRADLALIEERYWDYEQELLKVVRDDEVFSSTRDTDLNLKRNIQDSVLNRGIDRSLVLYRIPDSFSLDAHRRLGIYYVQSGRYDQALGHLLFAVLKSYTRVIDEYRTRVLDFQFLSLKDLHTRMQGESGLLAFLESVGAYESLYYLGEAIYGFDQSKLPAAQEIWTFLVQTPEASQYHGVSRQQLESPQTFVRFNIQ
ncbi:MAG: tetratricopeptide repeat protein [Spirochaetales bacterium]|nr:tetratricopeptide repeat protein [Spirochaetales bacterium]